MRKWKNITKETNCSRKIKLPLREQNDDTARQEEDIMQLRTKPWSKLESHNKTACWVNEKSRKNIEAITEAVNICTISRGVWSHRLWSLNVLFLLFDFAVPPSSAGFFIQMTPQHRHLANTKAYAGCLEPSATILQKPHLKTITSKEPKTMFLTNNNVRNALKKNSY